MKKRKCFGLLLLAVLLLTLCAPVSAANKAVRIKAPMGALTLPYNTDDYAQKNANTYSFLTVMPKMAKLKSANTWSARLAIPASVFKKDGDNVYIWCDLGLVEQGTSNGSSYEKDAGTIYTRYTFEAVYQSGKLTVKRIDDLKDIYVTTGSYASVKKSGKNYIITMNKVPFQKKIEDNASGSQVKINTKKKYIWIPIVNVIGFVQTKVSPYLYLDQVSVKAASAQTATFNKKDYADVEIERGNGKTVKAKITTIK